jgi:starch phosphorylase
VEVKSDGQQGMKVGESLDVHANIDLGALTPDDVTVELYHGMLNLSGEIANPTVLPMAAFGKPKGRVFEFLSTIKSESSGRQGYTVRILPHHPDIDNPLKQGLVLWA